MARILVSDDASQGALQLLRKEHAVCVSEGGKETLDALAGAQFDLLFTDLANPNMVGQKLIQEVTRLYPELPVVVCTASASDRIISEVAEGVPTS